MAYKHILFDLDGTLTDPMLGITNSVIYALKHYGFPVPEREKLHFFIGPPLINSFEEYCGFSREKAVEAMGVYREYFGEKGILENEVYAGIPELLEKLVNSGKKLYLASSKPELYCVRILRHFDILKYFTFVAANTMEEDRSEKSDIIEWLYENCPEVKSEGAIMVGDTEFDVIGAHAQALPCVAVTYGYGNRQNVDKNSPEFYADSVKELSEILLSK